MGRLFLIIFCSIIVTGVLYSLANRISPFRNTTQPLSPFQKLLCYFMVLYVPVQLIILLAAGHRMPIANTKGHEAFAATFTIIHAILAVMGMVVSKYFYGRHKAALTLLTLNAASAIFYFMAATIFLLFT